MEVYELSRMLDDPRFTELEFPEKAPSLLGNKKLSDDFKRRNGGKFGWEPVSLSAVWRPQEVVGGVEPYNDYPEVAGIAAFSQRAVDALRDLLEPNGELLPLVSPRGTYFAYNVMSKSDALDLTQTKATFGPPGDSKETAYFVEYFAFDESKIRHDIFRLREYPAAVFVTDTFKKRAEDAGLNGLYFAKVWPYPNGESWERIDKQRKRESRKKLEPLRGQCLAIGLGVKDSKATREEESQGRVIVNALSELLSKSRASIEDPILGSIDELDAVARELRIYVTCPDVDQLFGVVKPWLFSIEWPREVRCYKIYGNRFEKGTKTIPVPLN